MKTDYILAHEQGHFDITEVYARKLNEALSEYKFNPESFKQDISDIYQKIVDEKEAAQEAYDDETDHSRHRKIQLEWLDKIHGQLEETEPFSNYP
jgi:predicted secreted Zn-dependent protease